MPFKCFAIVFCEILHLRYPLSSLAELGFERACQALFANVHKQQIIAIILAATCTVAQARWQLLNRPSRSSMPSSPH